MPQLPEQTAAQVDEAEIRPGKVARPYGKRVQIAPRPDVLLAQDDAHGDPPEGELVPWYNAAEVLRRTAAERRRWLIQRVVPQGGYGTIGAGAGVGKSWAALDAAVSVTTGTRWLSAFPCGRGRVALVYGEGEQHDFARRVRAICEAKRLEPERAVRDLWLCPYPLDLTNPKVIEEIGGWLKEVRPALAIVDPLYLMQGGTSGRNVAEMGGLLRGITEPCLRAGSALLTVTHFNKTGEGNGAGRITGTGSQEWARFVITLNIEHEDTKGDEHDTRDVQLSMGFHKSIAGRYLVRRRTSTEDPDELDSPMHYKVAVYEDGGRPATSKATGDGLSPGKRKVLAAMAKLGPDASAAQLAAECGLERSTASKYRKELRQGGDD